MLALSLLLAVAAPQHRLPPSVQELLLRSNRPITTTIPVPPSARGLTFAAGTPLVVYLNRFGGSYTCNGLDNDAAANVSSIACETVSGVANVGGFSGSDAQWTQVRDCVSDLFSPFRLTVTDVEPVDVDYVEAVVGGSPAEAGMPFGVGGVSPFSCGVIPGAIVYAFADVYGNDTRGICETAAQEIAHAFGLEHEFLCADPMTYLTDCGEKAFQDQFAPCGEFEPRACDCGSSTQNSVQAMMELFGAADGSVWTPPADNAVPTVELVSPNDGEIVDANSIVVVTAHASDDVGLAAVELEYGITGDVLFCPMTTDGYTCSKEGDTYIWQIEDTTGSRPFRVHVRDVVGKEATSEDRTLWLSADGKGPPKDVSPPSIALGSPLPGQIMPTATPFDIVATIVDDNGIALAEMNWPRRGQDFWIPCPYADDRVSCTVEGTTYRWNVQGRRDGERTFTLRATDVLGKVTELGPLPLMMTTGAELPVSDGHDTLDDAGLLACGESADLDGNSASWFAVAAGAGNAVTVTVSGAEAPGVIAVDGSSPIASGDSVVEFDVQKGASLSVGVLPRTAGEAVHVEVTCEKIATPPAPATCAGGAPAAPAALALALAALRRRRRRA